MSETTRYVQDPRMDKFIAWGFSTATVVALSVGAFFFRGVTAGVTEQAQATVQLREAISELKTEIALLSQTEKGLAELKVSTTAKFAELKASTATKFAEAREERKDLDGRLRSLETRIR